MTRFDRWALALASTAALGVFAFAGPSWTGALYSACAFFGVLWLGTIVAAFATPTNWNDPDL